MEIDKIRTTAYKPSTNGALERVYRTLNTMLGKIVSKQQRCTMRPNTAQRDIHPIC